MGHWGARNCRLRLPQGLRIRLRLWLYLLHPTKLATAASAGLSVATSVPGQSSVSGVSQSGHANTDFSTRAYRITKAEGWLLWSRHGCWSSLVS